MESSSLYRTEYIIWDNFGLEQQDEPLAAYQLSAAVLGRLGITTLMTAFQQTCREELHTGRTCGCCNMTPLWKRILL